MNKVIEEVPKDNEDGNKERIEEMIKTLRERGMTEEEIDTYMLGFAIHLAKEVYNLKIKDIVKKKNKNKKTTKLGEQVKSNTNSCNVCNHKEEKQDLFLLDNKYYCEYCLIEALATKGIIGLEQTDEGRIVLY